jgi:hypothetical protein
MGRARESNVERRHAERARRPGTKLTRFGSSLADLEQQRKALITHQVEIALNREDPDNAIRAFAELAKIAGWAAPIK